MGCRRRILVVGQLLLMATKLVPGDVAGVPLQQDNVRIFLLQSARSSLDPWFFTRSRMSARLGSPIDVGSCIHWAVQDIQDSPMTQANPLQFSRARSTPMPCRKAQLLLGKVTHDRQRRLVLLEEGENQTDRFLDGFVGIEHQLADWIIDQPTGRAKAQLSLFGFGQLAALQSLMQPMEFRLAHRPLKPQQETVVVRSRIIDTFLVNDQRISECTDLQQAIPITARTSQARDFQTQDCSHVAQSHLGHQPLKTVASNGRCAGLSLILVNNLDNCMLPSQLLRTLDQGILARGASAVLANLPQV